MITTKKIIKLEFPTNQYVREVQNKTQVVLHHTVSGSKAKGVANYWKSDTKRISTCMIIDNKGVPFQLFSSKYWGFHLGIKKKVFKANNIVYYKRLDKNTIGVELTNWGGLHMIDDELYTVYGSKFNGTYVYYEDGYRGFNYFERYTNAQIETLRELLLYWNKRYDISLEYNTDIWDVTTRALKGYSGIFTP